MQNFNMLFDRSNISVPVIAKKINKIPQMLQ